MAWLKKLLLICVSVAVALAVFLLSSHNMTPVHVDLIVFEVMPLPVAVWIGGAFVLGGVLGLSLNYVAALRYQFTAHRLQRNLDKIKDEERPAMPSEFAEKKA